LEEEILEFDLLERLDSEDLCELRKYFFSSDTEVKKKLVQRKQLRHTKNGRAKAEQGLNYGGKPLTKREFVKAIEEVVGK
jgi:hypothetical protein